MPTPRRLIDRAAIGRPDSDLLTLLSIDPESEGPCDSPPQTAVECAEPLTPESFALTTFPNGERYEELVVVGDIAVQSPCLHGFPFVGVADIGSIPVDHVPGLSRLARVVARCARDRLLQKPRTTPIARWFQTKLEPRAMRVVLETDPLYMSLRGVRQAGREHCYVGTAGPRW